MFDDIFVARLRYPGGNENAIAHQHFVYKEEKGYIYFFPISSMTKKEPTWAGMSDVFIIMGHDRIDNDFVMNSFVRLDTVYKVRLSRRIDVSKISMRSVTKELKDSLLGEIKKVEEKGKMREVEFGVSYFLKFNKKFIKEDKQREEV